jgi:hypothetical protein
LSRNVKLTHRFAKQNACLLETYKIVFVSKAVNNVGNDFAWQVANIDSANVELASLAHHHCFSLFAFALLSFCPDYK